MVVDKIYQTQQLWSEGISLKERVQNVISKFWLIVPQKVTKIK